jgi:TolA-binding protein
LLKLEPFAELLSDRLEDPGRRISNLPAKLRSGVSSSPEAATDNGASLADTSRANQLQQLPGSLRLYESAYQNLIKGHYALAREGFMQYLRLLPEGEMADNAQYWIGESYLAQQQFEQALQAFQTVIDKYPTHGIIANVVSPTAPTRALKPAVLQVLSQSP